MLEAFIEYLVETFEEEYDPMNIRHITFRNVFEAGYEAANRYRDHRD